MKKFFQLFLLAISVLISSTSCSSYPYTEDDEQMGFGPVDQYYIDLQNKFKTDDSYSIHDDNDYDERDEY